MNSTLADFIREDLIYYDKFSVGFSDNDCEKIEFVVKVPFDSRIVFDKIEEYFGDYYILVPADEESESYAQDTLVHNVIFSIKVKTEMFFVGFINIRIQTSEGKSQYNIKLNYYYGKNITSREQLVPKMV